MRQMLKKIACPLCGSAAGKIIYDLRTSKRHLWLPGTIHQCESCHVLYKIYNTTITTLYDEKYVQEVQKNSYAQTESPTKFYQTLLKNTECFQKQGHHPLRLLDIGCGTGSLLQVATSLGFEAEGIEINFAIAQEAAKKGLHVHNCDIMNMPNLQLQRFNVITMTDIIEHLPYPIDVLNMLQEYLTDNGEIIIFTPNHDSPIVKFSHVLYKSGLKKPIETIFASTHVTFFTAQTLLYTLLKTHYRIKKSNLFPYDPQKPGGQFSSWLLFLIWMLEKIGSLIGLKGFRMIIYASKQGGNDNTLPPHI